jgi:hypothetical protein
MIDNDNIKNVTRVEVIDWTKPAEEGGGRVYVNWSDAIEVEIQLQDDYRTLKLFIKERT